MSRKEQSAAVVEGGGGVADGRRVILICLLLFGLVAVAFLPAIRNGFVNFDDPDYVTANGVVQSGLTWAGIRWAFQSTTASNWHPVTWLSHMLDSQLYAWRPWGHHLTSVLLHAANTLLLFLVLRRMTGAVWRSAFAAALFGLHPLRVESVAWVAERKDVLSTLFWLLTMGAYGRYAEFKIRSAKLKMGERIWFGAALVFFALGLMSKPMVVTLPFVLLLLDYWPLGRVSGPSGGISRRRIPLDLLLEKWPFFLLSAASGVVTFLVQKRGGAMVLMAGQPFEARLENAVVSYCRYLGKFFWPQKLSVIYPVVDHWPQSTVVLSLCLLLGISILAVLVRRRFAYVLTGWFWYVGTLVPVIGVVAVGEQAMADRYTYVPMIGVVVLVAWGVDDLTRRWRQRSMAMSAAAAGVIVMCLVLTRQNAGYWRSSETLFEQALAVTENNYGANSMLGTFLIAQGRLDEALGQFAEAARLMPDSAEARLNLGAALATVKRYDEAILQLQESLKRRPNEPGTHLNLGKAFEESGRLDEAIREYREAVRLNPGSVSGRNTLGVALAKQGLLDEAIGQFQEAIRLDPGDDSSHNNLGIALSQKGRLDEAILEFREAIRLNPDNASAQQNLKLMLEPKGG
jgi:protein O-mannosyl-transferase